MLDKQIARENLYLYYEAMANSVVVTAATGSATLYDLTSRSIPATAQKGLYIKNGAKYVKAVETKRLCP